MAAWIAGSLAFGFYVSHFGSYNKTYGALGGVVALMVWFYMTAYVLLLGAELNALIAQHATDTVVPSADGEAFVPAREHATHSGFARTRLGRALGSALVLAIAWRSSGKAKAHGSRMQGQH